MRRFFPLLASLSFVDSVKVLIASGAGGDGVSIMAHEHGNEFAGPGGGNGGNGGSVFARCTSKYTDLRHIEEMGPQIAAAPGCCGYSRQAHGKRGKNAWLELPVGTQITDVDTNEVLFDLDKEGVEVLLLEGGQGGKGNAAFANKWRHTPVESTRGLPGNTLLAQIEVKMIADCGLIGYPNAGKSSILGVCTTSKPPTAPYPFTTLRPYVGLLHTLSGSSCRIADLPGLIEGAYENRGLGHQFLRHVERSTTLVYVVDISGTSSLGAEAPLQPWEAVERMSCELDYYSPGLSKRSIMVFANKMDLLSDAREAESRLEALRRHTGLPVFPVSAAAANECGDPNAPEAGFGPALKYLTDHVFAVQKAKQRYDRERKVQEMLECQRMFETKYNGIFARAGSVADGDGRRNELSGEDMEVGSSLVDQQLNVLGNSGYESEEADGYEYSLARRQLHAHRDFTMRGTVWRHESRPR